MHNLPRPAKIAILVGTPILVVFALIAGLIGSYSSIRSAAISHEEGLNAEFRANQNALSSYVLTIKESLGVADAGSDKLNDILVSAVTDRYDEALEPGTGGEGDPLFSAITEVYPDLTATAEMYAKVQDEVAGGRSMFKGRQELLQDKIRAYNQWRDQGLWRSFVTSNFLGLPSDRLEARVGDRVWRGNDALDKMKEMVLDDTTLGAFEDGTMEPLIEVQD